MIGPVSSTAAIGIPCANRNIVVQGTLTEEARESRTERRAEAWRETAKAGKIQNASCRAVKSTSNRQVTAADVQKETAVGNSVNIRV